MKNGTAAITLTAESETWAWTKLPNIINAIWRDGWAVDYWSLSEIILPKLLFFVSQFCLLYVQPYQFIFQ